MEFKHIPVMLNECVEALQIKDYGIYFDGTLGLGSHSKAILQSGANVRLIATDLDTQAIASSKISLSEFENRTTFVHDNFKNFKAIMDKHNIGLIDGALLDLGVSSYQLDDKTRGFSYMAEDERLNMRMNQEAEISAYDVVNGYSEKQLVRILQDYGEEKFAKNIARNICIERQKRAVETCGQLVRIIDASIPKKYSSQGHPAKRTFQAIRIEVNGELEGLSEAIKDIVFGLKKGGRLAVITFQSLEDRIVKNTFRELETDCTCDKSLPVCVCGKRREIELVNKKPIVAGDEEIAFNPRAKSAKLRICERI